jgi:hypothetical protein
MQVGSFLEGVIAILLRLTNIFIISAHCEEDAGDGCQRLTNYLTELYTWPTCHIWRNGTLSFTQNGIVHNMTRLVDGRSDENQSF